MPRKFFLGGENISQMSQKLFSYYWSDISPYIIANDKDLATQTGAVE